MSELNTLNHIPCRYLNTFLSDMVKEDVEDTVASVIFTRCYAPMLDIMDGINGKINFDLIIATSSQLETIVSKQQGQMQSVRS